MFKSKLKYVLYPLGVYTAYVGVTHVITQHKIQNRAISGSQDDEQFSALKVFGRFENPFSEYRPQTLYEFLLMRIIEIWEGEHGALHEDIEIRKEHVGWKMVDLKLLSKLTSDTLNNVISYTWIGQSCGLVTMPRGGPKILLDPLFEPHLVSSLGPKRILPIPITLDEVMEKVKPEYVVVSHDHPDHLERESIERIGDDATWIVPIGVGSYLKRNGVSLHNIKEMNWWQRMELPSESNNDHYEIICLPAMHWSGRMLIDANLSLWSSFLILRNGKSMFYHAGDTGYTSPLFDIIGKKYGSTKLAALPIGQYCPEWHQAPRHIGPKESLKICEEMKIKCMVGVHWGTFVLSSEKYWEPGHLLNKLSKEWRGETNVIVPKLGSTITIDDDDHINIYN